MERPEGGEPPPVEQLAEVTRELEDASSPTRLWQRIVDMAVQTMPHCEMAGVSLLHPDGQVETAVATDEVVRQVDALQYETGEGPCIDAIREHEMFVTEDLAREQRWPDFSRRAKEETGVHAMIGQWLFLQRDTLGALNLYSRKIGAFDQDDEAMSALLAAHAALAMFSAKEREHSKNLEAALQSNRIIGVAVGMLMESRHVDRETAFAILSGASQRYNVKVHVLAEQLVKGHEAALTAPES